MKVAVVVPAPRVGVHETEHGERVAVYPVMALPPSEAGADQLATTWSLEPVAVRPETAPGTVAVGVKYVLGEAGPEPEALEARTVNAWSWPAVRLFAAALVELEPADDRDHPSNRHGK